jgi:hypothetical protein
MPTRKMIETIVLALLALAVLTFLAIMWMSWRSMRAGHTSGCNHSEERQQIIELLDVLNRRHEESQRQHESQLATFAAALEAARAPRPTDDLPAKVVDAIMAQNQYLVTALDRMAHEAQARMAAFADHKAQQIVAGQYIQRDKFRMAGVAPAGMRDASAPYGGDPRDVTPPDDAVLSPLRYDPPETRLTELLNREKARLRREAAFDPRTDRQTTGSPLDNDPDLEPLPDDADPQALAELRARFTSTPHFG